jgi:group I intron endonuclease
MIIYKITNKINGKIYIGQTTGPLNKRWNDHCCYKKNRCSVVSQAIQKYGKKNFEVKPIAYCDSLEQMNHREPYYIKLLKTLTPNGYNIKEGGNGGGKCTEETKEKLRQINLGKRHSAETKEKVSKAGLGHLVSLKTREKLSQAHSNPLVKERKRQAMLGHEVSSETRKKISQVLLGHEVSSESRKKMSEAKIELPSWNKGGNISEETKEKLRQINLGKKHSPETIEKLKQIAKLRKENLFIGLIVALNYYKQ